jgi:branched-chain amino acid transport system permease protein
MRGLRDLLPEAALLLAGIAVFFVVPDDLGLATRVVIGALFALSLDLVLGYAGIVTLGHAAMFGVGAYAAGVVAIRVWDEPVSGLLIGAAAGAAIAWLSGKLVLRSHGLTSVMITLAVAQVLLEVASKWTSVTGGDDGLSGIAVKPLLGLFEFDFMGRTGYLYALAVLVLCLGLLRRVVASPFGLACVGIREDRGRMAALGYDVPRQMSIAYMLGGAFAGVAGALSAQITQVVGLSSLGFAHSADVLVMLVLGGTGRLWGALIGTGVFMLVHHAAANVDPFRWMLVIGVMLAVVVLVLPGGLSGAASRLWAVLRGDGRRVRPSASAEQPANAATETRRLGEVAP